MGDLTWIDIRTPNNQANDQGSMALRSWRVACRPCLSPAGSDPTDFRPASLSNNSFPNHLHRLPDEHRQRACGLQRALRLLSEKPSEIGPRSQVDPGVMISMENIQSEPDPRVQSGFKGSWRDELLMPFKTIMSSLYFYCLRNGFSSIKRAHCYRLLIDIPDKDLFLNIGDLGY